MQIIKKENIVLGLAPESHEDAIRRCGKMLVSSGYVNEKYIEGMLARDKSFSTSIGNAIAIPHGEMEYKKEILNTGLVVCTYPKGISWNGDKVKLVIGIAAKGDEHLEILGKIVDAFEDESAVDAIATGGSVEAVYKILAPNGEE
ncbi:MAG: PTS sugar transporter subunit IIA [Clostridiales bacterium]|jgi:mannitol/fructose-specific phosphotransferase system IIA component|nr:PTS sugar transporter subunit IIA [Clostridiales bacterium]